MIVNPKVISIAPAKAVYQWGSVDHGHVVNYDDGSKYFVRGEIPTYKGKTLSSKPFLSGLARAICFQGSMGTLNYVTVS